MDEFTITCTQTGWYAITQNYKYLRKTGELGTGTGFSSVPSSENGYWDTKEEVESAVSGYHASQPEA